MLYQQLLYFQASSFCLIVRIGDCNMFVPEITKSVLSRVVGRRKFLSTGLVNLFRLRADSFVELKKDAFTELATLES